MTSLMCIQLSTLLHLIKLVISPKWFQYVCHPPGGSIFYVLCTLLMQHLLNQRSCSVSLYQRSRPTSGEQRYGPVLKSYTRFLFILQLKMQFAPLRCVFVFKVIHGFAPTYLRELVSIKRSENYKFKILLGWFVACNANFQKQGYIRRQIIPGHSSGTLECITA